MRLLSSILLTIFFTSSVAAQWQDIDPSGLPTDKMLDTQVAIDGDKTYCFYSEFNMPNSSVLMNDGTGWSFLGSQSFLSSEIRWSDIQVNNNIPYISYKLNDELIVQRYINNVWETVGGIAVTNTSGTQNVSLDFINDQPVVAYQVPTGRKINVKIFDGTSWNDLGATNIGNHFCWNPDFLTTPSGEAYLSFREFEQTGNPDTANSLQVLQYNGASWTYLPEVAPIAPNSDDSNPLVRSSLAYDESSDELYVGYIISDENNVPFRKAVVQKWDGISWTMVGNPIIDVALINRESMTLSFTDKLYMHTNEDDNSAAVGNRMAVRVFENGTWNAVGSELFASVGGSNDTDYFTSFAAGQDRLVVSYAEDFPTNGVLKIRELDLTTLSSDQESLSEVRVFPNPTSDVINLSGFDSFQEMRIYSLDGREVLLFDQERTEYNLGSLASGTYLAMIGVNNNVVTKKIVVN
ncbi:MAG: T9SS type A sorting domain-containing protein [Nonlabens sp.]